MPDLPFTQRVDEFLELASEIEGRRLTRTGIDLGARFEWGAGQQMMGRLGPMDDEDFRSFLAAWRQLVMLKEPTHLPTLLGLCADHLTVPRLRELAKVLLDRVNMVNANEVPLRPRFAFLDGDHEYTPWQVADLVMNGAVFHRARKKRAILDALDPGLRAMLEWSFRQYVVDITEVMHLTHLILLKAKDSAALSDTVGGTWVEATSPQA